MTSTDEHSPRAGRFLDRLDPGPFLGPQAVVWLAAAMAGLGGLGEALYRSARQLLTHRPGAMYHWELLWMAPLSAAVAGALVGLCVALAASFLGRRVGGRNAVILFGFTAVYPVVQQEGIPLHWLADVVLSVGVAYVVADLLRARLGELDGRVMALRRRVAATFAALALTGLADAALSNERLAVAGRPAAAPGLPNVLLIILDTVRAANLSLHGYHRPTTPWLDEWASSGIVFDRAYATAPWTLPSHGSFFTGRYANELDADFRRPLASQHPTLAEVLAGHGYVTAGFVANVFYASRMSGLQRGFDRYEAIPVDRHEFVRSSWLSFGLVRRIPFLDRPFDFGIKTAEDVATSFLEWERRPRDRPYFAFLNVWDTHAPYEPPREYWDLFGPSPSEEWEYVFATWGQFPDSAYTAERVRLWQNRYDGAIRYIDDRLRVMFDALRLRGALENTLVIIASDHGEMWGERGQIDHATSLYAPLLHVPLVISFPGRIDGGRRVAGAVSLRDLPATILDVIGLSSDSPIPGASLRAFWDASAPPASPSRPRADLGLYPEDIAEWAPGVVNWAPAMRGPMFSLIDDSLHYIVNGDGVEELYNIRRDPFEAIDLVGLPTTVEALGHVRLVADSLR